MMESLSTILGDNQNQTQQSNLAIIIEDSSNRRLALLVDEIIGQQQIVVKNIGPGTGKTEGISGAAIMGDGSINLILDVNEIINGINRSI